MNARRRLEGGGEMARLTDFFACGESELEEDSNDDEKRHVELDAFDPARLVRVDVHSPLVKLHLLRLHVQYAACDVPVSHTRIYTRCTGRTDSRGGYRMTVTPPETEKVKLQRISHLARHCWRNLPGVYRYMKQHARRMMASSVFMQ